MIITVAVYTLVVASVIGVMAVLLERGAAILRWPVRWVWVVAMSGMVVIPLGTTAWSYSRPSERVEIVPVKSIPVLGVETPTELAPARAGGRPSALATTLSEAISPLDYWSASQVSLTQRTAAWDRTLTMVWLILSMSLLVRVMREVRRVQRLSHTMPERVIVGTSVRVSDAVGPAAIGGRTPLIVLPAWVLEMDEKLVDLVVEHEREHLEAGDTRLMMLGIGWLVLMPWLVLLWWAWHRLRLAIELDCDARVLRRCGTPRNYAQLLLFISQRRGNMRVQAPLPGPLLLAFNPHRLHLERRISAMTARPGKHPVKLLITGIAIAATATIAAAIPSPRRVERMVRATSVSSAKLRPGTPPSITRVQKVRRAVSLKKGGAGVPAVPATDGSRSEVRLPARRTQVTADSSPTSGLVWRTENDVAQPVTADSDSLQVRLSALDSALIWMDAPPSARSTVQKLRSMLDYGLPDVDRAALSRRLDAFEPYIRAARLAHERKTLSDTLVLGPRG